MNKYSESLYIDNSTLNELYDFSGIPLPQFQKGFNGIDLYGDGKILKDNKNKPEKHIINTPYDLDSFNPKLTRELTESALYYLKEYESDIYAIDRLLEKYIDYIPFFKSWAWKQSEYTGLCRDFNWIADDDNQNCVYLVIGEFLNFNIIKELDHNANIDEYNKIKELAFNKIKQWLNKSHLIKPNFQLIKNDSDLIILKVDTDIEMKTESNQIFTEAKKDARTSVIENGIYKTIEDHLSKQKNITSIINVVSTWKNNNFEILSQRYPIKNLIISIKETNEILDAIGISKEDLLNTLKEIKEKITIGETQTLIASIQLLGFLIAYVYFLKTDNEQMQNIMIYIISITEYSLIFRKYFSKTDPNPQIMEYTIEHLSEKFKITKSHNLEEWIVDINGRSSINFHKNALITNKDIEYIDALVRLRNTFNIAIKHITSKYLDNYQKRNRIITDTEMEYDITSSKSKSYIIGNNKYNAIINNKINTQILKTTCEYYKTSYDDSYAYIKTIIKNKEYELNKFIIYILEYFFEKNDNIEITSKQFLSFGLDIASNIILRYKRKYSNIHDIISIWINKLELDKTLQSRQLQNYIGSIILYFIFIIQRYN